MNGDEPGSRPPPIPELVGPGVLTRLRSLAVDLTPLRRSREFRLLWLGQSVSDIGTLGIAWVAVPYQVFSITRSPLAVGLVALFELIPVLGLGLVGGRSRTRSIAGGCCYLRTSHKPSDRRSLRSMPVPASSTCGPCTPSPRCEPRPPPWGHRRSNRRSRASFRSRCSPRLPR
jgi:hypothetical protein